MRYIYGGMKLEDYCKKNDIDYKEISNRIKNITEQGYKLSGKEMLDIVLKDEVYNSFIEPTTNYYYNDIPLDEYCLNNGINYRLILGRIYSLKKEGVKKDNLVIIALNDDLFYKKSKKYKYLYKDKTLKKFCEENNYDYPVMARRYSRLKIKYPDFEDDEIFKIIFDEKLYFQTTDIYNYGGMPLSKYCDSNGLDYNNIVQRMKRTKAKDYKIKTQDALTEAVKHYEYIAMKKLNTCRYYYKGIAIKKYCEANGINYNMIRHRIKKLRSINPDFYNDELARIAFNDEEYITYVNNNYGNVRYYYNGIPLKVYCENEKRDYDRVLTRIESLKGKVDEDKIVETALDDDKYHSFVSVRKHGKYYIYKGYTLKKYCKLNSLNHIKVLEEILKIDTSNTEMIPEEVIDLAIKRQDPDFVFNEKIQEIRKQREQLQTLKEQLLGSEKQDNKILIKK